MGGWSSDEDTSTQAKLTLSMYYENEATRVFKNWRKNRFHWRDIFPELPRDNKIQLDLVGDLLKVDIGVLFRAIRRHNPKRLKFGDPTDCILLCRSLYGGIFLRANLSLC